MTPEELLAQYRAQHQRELFVSNFQRMEAFVHSAMKIAEWLLIALDKRVTLAETRLRSRENISKVHAIHVQALETRISNLERELRDAKDVSRGMGMRLVELEAKEKNR